MVRGRWGRSRFQGRRTLIEWITSGFLSALVVILLSYGSVADRPNFLIYDSLVQAQPGAAVDDIVLIAIDDRSLETLGRWPWPRTYHAQMMQQLGMIQPRAVAYDVLFVEPETSDDDLAQAVKQTQNVYLPVLIDPLGANGASWKIQLPSSPLAEAAKGLGHVNLAIDSDGVIRRLPLYLQTGTTLWPHLVLPLAQSQQTGDLDADILAEPDLIPDPAMLARRSEFITYRAKPGAYTTVSFVDVLRGEVPEEFLKDRLVLVGSTAAGLGDRYATPNAPDGELMPGVEVQAALLQTLLEGGGRKPLPQDWHLGLSLLPLLVLFVSFIYLRPMPNMMVGLCLMALVLGSSAALFFWARLWFAPAPALAGLLLAYPLWSWRRLATASAYMQSELEAFERERGAAPVQA